MDLSGKVVIVTGGCRGVGRGISSRFLEAGANVVICCRNEPAELPAAGERTAVFVQADVRRIDQIDTVIDATLARFGRLDVLVNNAGGSPMVKAADASPRFSEAIISLNLIAPLNFSRSAHAVMQTQEEGGCIVNIGSASGRRPSPGTAAYGAAKAGLHNLTATLAMEWAPEVRVNCIAIGPVRTEYTEESWGGEAGLAEVAAVIPLGRLAEPKDVADLCLFLVSPAARYITGATIDLQGGGEWVSYLREQGPL
jgi:NAD(P)-dependent dehydrogenase (short-subunit alcohol dehydrogenase family)